MSMHAVTVMAQVAISEVFIYLEFCNGRAIRAALQATRTTLIIAQPGSKN